VSRRQSAFQEMQVRAYRAREGYIEDQPYNPKVLPVAPRRTARQRALEWDRERQEQGLQTAVEQIRGAWEVRAVAPICPACHQDHPCRCDWEGQFS
jgi:hypothetical protein